MTFEQRAVPDLLDVGPVGVHREQVAHDVPVAHAVLRLARRTEHDPIVRQVDRIDVRDPRAERQLPQPAAVRVHLVNVVVVRRVPAASKTPALAREMDVDVPGDARGAPPATCESSHRRPKSIVRIALPPRKLGRVDLAGLEHRLRVVMVRRILRPHHEDNRSSGHDVWPRWFWQRLLSGIERASYRTEQNQCDPEPTELTDAEAITVRIQNERVGSSPASRNSCGSS